MLVLLSAFSFCWGSYRRGPKVVPWAHSCCCLLCLLLVMGLTRACHLPLQRRRFDHVRRARRTHAHRRHEAAQRMRLHLSLLQVRYAIIETLIARADRGERTLIALAICCMHTAAVYVKPTLKKINNRVQHQTERRGRPADNGISGGAGNDARAGRRVGVGGHCPARREATAQGPHSRFRQVSAGHRQSARFPG